MSRIYFGGDIITMTGEENYPEALVEEQGKIKYVGTLEDAVKFAGEGAEQKDLKGRTLMPAFLDGHGHVQMTAQMLQMADLSGCVTFSQIIDTLREYIEANNLNETDIVVGFGYDHNFLEEKAHPVKKILNQVSERIPVYVSHASGHMGCCNDRLLELADITTDTPDPEGGIIGREEGSSEPNGYLEEAAMLMAQKLMAARIKLNISEGLKKAQQLYLKYGVTTVQDGAASAETVALMKKMCESGQFELDVVAYPAFGQIAKGEPEDLFKQYPEHAEKYKSNFKLGGYKAILDGSPQGKSAWLTEPYENDGEYKGYPWFRDEVVKKFMKAAIQNGRQILVHCNGDAAGDQFLDAYESALKEENIKEDQNLRPVMIHCQTARDDQLKRMSEMKIIPSIFTGHVYYWGDIHVKNLGRRRGERVSPCASALKYGLIMNFHQDTPVTKPDVLHSVWSAVNRITRSGKVIGEEQCIGVYDALKAVTINTAYAYHEEDSKGTLEAGKNADFVILDGNPLKVEKQKINKIKVLETIKAGHTLYLCEK